MYILNRLMYIIKSITKEDVLFKYMQHHIDSSIAIEVHIMYSEYETR